MRPDELIALARELARRETGRPKSVSLRRAVSTTYYALFHALAGLCADSLVGRKPWDLYTPIYRSLEHGRARAALNVLRQQSAPGAPISTVAVAFAVLQDARHEADYSPQPFSLDRSATLTLISSAEQAIVALNDLTPDETLALAIRLVVKSR